jgi:hypothetical protein
MKKFWENYENQKYICIDNLDIVLNASGHNFKELILNETYCTHSPWAGYFNGENTNENNGIQPNDGSIYINNGDKVMRYHKYRFITLAEFREQRINKILDEKISKVDAPSFFSRNHK